MSSPSTPVPVSSGTPDASPSVIWRRADGSVVSCFEKVKVLNENYAELRELLQDALDDALLLGCSEAQVRAAFRALVDGVEATVSEDARAG
ncbi:hypothetical protein [Brachymonas sp. M4Q-1]|uniref:hypothetical protein n=1 Tax=Brachymonas sp. M4Q-1 TaxID=3416906 RepID=UPI003CFAD8DC